MPLANSYLTCGSCMCPQCVSLFLLIIENYDMGVRYTPLRSTTTNPVGTRVPAAGWDPAAAAGVKRSRGSKDKEDAAAVVEGVELPLESPRKSGRGQMKVTLRVRGL